MDERFSNDRPIEQQAGASTSGRVFLVLSALLVVPLLLIGYILLKPAAAHATLAQVTGLLGSRSEASLAPSTSRGASAAAPAKSGPRTPQSQAEGLLQQAVNGSSDALEQLETRMPDWQGQLTMTPQMSGLLDAAVNANDLRVRAAALDLELAANNLSKTREDEDSLIERIDKEPAARPWGLWMLGAMAGRGVEPVRALTVLVQYAHDPDETTRYWAVAGMALVGSDPTVQLLLEIFHDDPSPRVRETAGCGLAQAGMLTREQRRRAAPELVRYAGDASLDANTRTWVYQALHDITGANVANDPVAWREWLAENGSN
jgi:hypothetical protein